MQDVDYDALPTVAEARAMASAWGDNDAARAVRLEQFDDRLKAARELEPRGPEDTAWIEERMGRAGFEYQPSWSTLEEAAQQYGKSVEEMAYGLQDAYWLMTHGVRPRTEADKLHELMWGERVKQREGWEWSR